MTPRRRSLRDRFHAWPYYSDGLMVLDRGVEEVAEWLRDLAKDVEAGHTHFFDVEWDLPDTPADKLFARHLRYLADLAEEP